MLIALKLAKVKLKSLFRQLKPLWFMVVFLLIINIISYRSLDTTVLFSIFNYPIYAAAVYQTFYIFYSFNPHDITNNGAYFFD